MSGPRCARSREFAPELGHARDPQNCEIHLAPRRTKYQVTAVSVTPSLFTHGYGNVTDTLEMVNIGVECQALLDTNPSFHMPLNEHLGVLRCSSTSYRPCMIAAKGHADRFVRLIRLLKKRLFVLLLHPNNNLGVRSYTSGIRHGHTTLKASLHSAPSCSHHPECSIATHPTFSKVTLHFTGLMQSGRLKHHHIIRHLRSE